MAKPLTDDEKRLVKRLRSADLVDAMKDFFKRRLDAEDKALRVQTGEMLYRSQGRAQILDELIQALDTTQ